MEVPRPFESSEGVEHRLVKRLSDAGAAYAQSAHRPVFTSAEAAEVRGAPLNSGAKALVVKADDGFMMAVIPADLALNSHALRKHLGSKRLRFASKDELLALTGLEPGAVPPFGSLFNLPTVCDHRLASNERINFNAGSHGRSIQMPYAEYLRVEGPYLADITESRGPAAPAA